MEIGGFDYIWKLGHLSQKEITKSVLEIICKRWPDHIIQDDKTDENFKIETAPADMDEFFVYKDLNTSEVCLEKGASCAVVDKLFHVIFYEEELTIVTPHLGSPDWKSILDSVNKLFLTKIDHTKWKWLYKVLSSLETNILIGEISDEDRELFFGPVCDFDEFHKIDSDTRYPQLLKQFNFFSSTGQARKAGWDKDIPEGFSYDIIGKKRRRVIIFKNTQGD